MHERRLEFKAEMTRRGLTQRDVARLLCERGHNAESYDVARIVAGRWDPPAQVRTALAEILGRPTFELFTTGDSR